MENETTKIIKKTKCEECGESIYLFKILKGEQKGNIYCEECLEDWKERELSESYEEIE